MIFTKCPFPNSCPFIQLKITGSKLSVNVVVPFCMEQGWPALRTDKFYIPTRKSSRLPKVSLAPAKVLVTGQRAFSELSKLDRWISGINGTQKTPKPDFNENFVHLFYWSLGGPFRLKYKTLVYLS